MLHRPTCIQAWLLCAGALLAGTRATPPRRLQQWALALEHRRGHNPAAVALANKLARIAWAVWTTGTAFDAPPPESILTLVPA